MTTPPGQSQILNAGYSPWQAPLAALFAGISAAGQPGGWSNFGMGVQQGQQNFQQGQQGQQMMQLRQMQIQQAEEEQRRANQEREEAQAIKQRLKDGLLGGPGSPTPTMAHGGYGAATGGIQTASGTAPLAAMFQNDPQKAAIFNMLVEDNPHAALQFITEQTFAQPKDTSTDDQREYKFAKSQGYQGNFIDFILDQKKAGASSTKVDVHSPTQPVLGDIPSGYAAIPDGRGGWTYQKVPGGPPAEAETNRTNAQNATADVVTTDINRALEQMDKAVLPTTGLIGSALSNVPGTASRDVAGLVQTIKGNIGIDKLQAMRLQSPTGGALGNVTEGELATLQSVIGNLEQSQSDEQFRYNLKRVYNTYRDIIDGKGNGDRYSLDKPSGPSGDSGELRYDSEGNPM
jgi:hypothetical protein